VFSPQVLDAPILHPTVDAHLFVPFVHYRLQELTDTNAVILSVTLAGIPSQRDQLRKLRITWDETTSKLRYPPVQASVVTEWAACGIACAILPVYTDFRLSCVTMRGERFDYWLDDGINLCGLEISGLLHGNISTRKQIKQKQLQANPHKVTGYVCIVHFSKAAVHFSFHGDSR